MFAVYCRQYRVLVFAWAAASALSGIGCEYAKAASQLTPQYVSAVDIETATAPQLTAILCSQILKGNFETAAEIFLRLPVSGSSDLKQLRMVIDEYGPIKTRRAKFRDEIFLTRTNELEELGSKNIPEKPEDITKVFSAIVLALECADDRHKKAILAMDFVKRTVRKAQGEADRFESGGEWLKAHTFCYSWLEKIYPDNNAYSDHAENLLQKANIKASFEHGLCQHSEDCYSDVKKNMFIKAVDILDSGYVKRVDYYQMATGAVRRCLLLAEVINSLSTDKRRHMKERQLSAWSGALRMVLEKVGQAPGSLDKNGFVKVFEKVLSINASNSAGLRLPEGFLIVQFGEGALSELDPYTAICWPGQRHNFEEIITNQFPGIGIRFSSQAGLVRVMGVLADTPAYEAGLRPGDIIESVDGIETADMSQDCLAGKIRGPEGTRVTLRIKCPTENTSADISIQRAKIIVSSVRGWRKTSTGRWRYMLDDRNGIGYVRIGCFNPTTAEDFGKVFEQLQREGLKALILDLRDNPGGLLSGAVEIADMFIPEGLIVRTQPRLGIATYVSAHKENTHPDQPLVVLVNGFTASAAEIVAGALQDPKYNRATTVGETTYGKGSVQSLTSALGGGAQLKYTASYYYLPSGDTVESECPSLEPRTDHGGILPDVYVKVTSDELERIAGVRSGNELGAAAAGGADSGRVNHYSNQAIIDADAQLAIGLLVLKAKMIQFGHRLVLN